MTGEGERDSSVVWVVPTGEVGMSLVGDRMTLLDEMTSGGEGEDTSLSFRMTVSKGSACGFTTGLAPPY